MTVKTIVECDSCKKQHRIDIPFGCIPFAWKIVSSTPPTLFGLCGVPKPDLHFCSKSCLKKWSGQLEEGETDGESHEQ
jgi:hypothetical protein